MIAVVNYGAGNLGSIKRMLGFLEFAHIVVSSLEDFDRESDISTIILPGVGDGSFMMEQLQKKNLIHLLQKWALENRPLLGICVGAQVLLSHTEEGNVEGLNLIEGSCRAFKSENMGDLKIPHMGWNELNFDETKKLFTNIPQKTNVYFVHSYFLFVKEIQYSVASTNYGINFSSVIGKGNVVGTQFHPEKSGKWGAKIIENFLLYYAREKKAC